VIFCYDCCNESKLSRKNKKIATGEPRIDLVGHRVRVATILTFAWSFGCYISCHPEFAHLFAKVARQETAKEPFTSSSQATTFHF